MEAGHRTIGKILRDSALLAALLAGLNVALDSREFGWLNLNPTPWTLLPILIGARYGSVPGLITGLLASAAIALVRSRQIGLEALDFVHAHLFTLSAIVLAGYLTGELQRMLRGNSQKLAEDNAALKDRAERLDAELQLTRETRHELQRSLLLHNARFACLDQELRRLVLLSPAQAHDALLTVLQQLADVTSAGLYLVEGNALRRLAVTHVTAPLAESIPLANAALAQEALESRTVASLKQPLASSASQPFLAALPWEDAHNRGVLLIQDMPLEAFDPRNLARIDMILRWVFTLRAYLGDCAVARDHRKPVQQEDFAQMLAQAFETEKSHSLPSAVMRVDAAEPSRCDAEAEQKILQLMPETMLFTRLHNGTTACLLPLAGETEARQITGVIAEKYPQYRASILPVAGPAGLQDIWSRLVES